MFLQSIGLLPDNIIILSSSREKAEESISNKLKKNFPSASNIDQMTKEAVDQYDLNIKSVRAIFQGFYSELNVEKKSKDSSLEELAVSYSINYLENIEIQEADFRCEKAT